MRLIVLTTNYRTRRGSLYQYCGAVTQQNEVFSSPLKFSFTFHLFRTSRHLKLRADINKFTIINYIKIVMLFLQSKNFLRIFKDLINHATTIFTIFSISYAHYIFLVCTHNLYLVSTCMFP